jgi:hypothetical protein
MASEMDNVFEEIFISNANQNIETYFRYTKIDENIPNDKFKDILISTLKQKTNENTFRDLTDHFYMKNNLEPYSINDYFFINNNGKLILKEKSVLHQYLSSLKFQEIYKINDQNIEEYELIPKKENDKNKRDYEVHYNPEFQIDGIFQVINKLRIEDIFNEKIKEVGNIYFNGSENEVLLPNDYIFLGIKVSKDELYQLQQAIKELKLSRNFRIRIAYMSVMLRENKVEENSTFKLSRKFRYYEDMLLFPKIKGLRE